MVINALAAQAKPAPSIAVGRFLFTSSVFLGLRSHPNATAVDGSEFVDPPRYRQAFRCATRGRAA